MKNQFKRRQFLARSSAACMGGCFLLATGDLHAFMRRSLDDEAINPEELCYCSYKCPEDCEFLVASQKNDPELKHKAFEKWDLEGRHGLKFDAEKIFCFKCKPGEKPEGPVLTHCTVRTCAMEKDYQACIQCDELKDCKKDLWNRFPDFHKAVIKMQAQYLEQA